MKLLVQPVNESARRSGHDSALTRDRSASLTGFNGLTLRFTTATTLLTALLGGCGDSGSNILPLEPGNKWSYQIRTGFRSQVETLAIGEEVPIGAIPGRQLTGPMGTSELGWNGGTLLAKSLTGTKLDPALPILVPQPVDDKETITQKWEGIITNNGKTYAATATLSQSTPKITFQGRTARGIRTVLELSFNGNRHTISSQYFRGFGLISQEESINDKWIRSLDYVSGP